MGTSTTSRSMRGSIRCAPGSVRAQPPRDGARELGTVQQRVGVCPLLRLIAESLRRLRGPQRMAKLAQQRHRRFAHFARVERPQHRDEPVLRRAELPRAFAPCLRKLDQRRGYRAQVPLAVAEDAGDAIDGAAGGSSLTKCVTSFVARNRAVAGWRTSARMTRSPSSTPPSSYRTPSTVFDPGSCRGS